MLALGLQGSPRRKGNSDILLSAFMDELNGFGIQSRIIDVPREDITPCKELTVCEKKGFCPIDDFMGQEVYTLLRKADIVVAASPVFFYNVSAQLKALIDRCQTLWARKYMLKLNDPGYGQRRGILLAVGATSGKHLFDGLHWTAKYFFDAVAAEYSGHLTFRGVERRGEINDHPTMQEEVARLAAETANGLAGRRKVLFACRENACRSQMAAAFTRLHGGDRLDATCAGSQPAVKVNPNMVAVMQEKGIDMAFHITQSLENAIADQQPEDIITMGCGEACPHIPGVHRQDWDLPDPAGQSIEFMRRVRDEIENRVKDYIQKK